MGEVGSTSLRCCGKDNGGEMIKQTFTLIVETEIGVNPNTIEKTVLNQLLNLGYSVGTKVEIIEKVVEMTKKTKNDGI